MKKTKTFSPHQIKHVVAIMQKYSFWGLFTESFRNSKLDKQHLVSDYLVKIKNLLS